MKVTLSVIKADVGSIGGHNRPSLKLMEALHDHLKKEGQRLLIDYKITHTGDDGCLLMSHTKGVDNQDIHRLAWDAFISATKVAKTRFPEMSGEWVRVHVKWSLKKDLPSLLFYLPVTKPIPGHLIIRFSGGLPIRFTMPVCFWLPIWLSGLNSASWMLIIPKVTGSSS